MSAEATYLPHGLALLTACEQRLPLSHRVIAAASQTLTAYGYERCTAYLALRDFFLSWTWMQSESDTYFQATAERYLQSKYEATVWIR
jgi:hypothetical protein